MTHETALIGALIVSVIFNALLFGMYRAADDKAFTHGRMHRFWEDQYFRLRRNSHRRCPETGRLLPKGE